LKASINITFVNYVQKFYQTSYYQRLTQQAEEIIGDHLCGFQHNRPTTDHILSAFVILLRKDGNTIERCLSYYVDFKQAYDSVRNEVLYNILIEFGIPMKTGKANKIV